MPKLEKVGLGIFTISTTGPRLPPQMIEPRAPLIVVQAPKIVVMDSLASDLPQIIGILQGADLARVTCRHPRRSPISTPEVPRVSVDIISPPNMDMDIFFALQYLQNTALPPHAYFGLRSMFGDENAKFVEFGIGSSLQQCWPLCSQLLVVSASKALVLTDSDATLGPGF